MYIILLNLLDFLELYMFSGGLKERSTSWFSSWHKSPRLIFLSVRLRITVQSSILLELHKIFREPEGNSCIPLGTYLGSTCSPESGFVLAKHKGALIPLIWENTVLCPLGTPYTLSLVLYQTKAHRKFSSFFFQSKTQ